MRVDLGIAAAITLAASTLLTPGTARADTLPKESLQQVQQKKDTPPERPPIKAAREQDKAAQTGDAPHKPPVSSTPVLRPKPKPQGEAPK